MHLETAVHPLPERRRRRLALPALLGLVAFLLAGLLSWRGIAVEGGPNPTAPEHPFARILDIGILVFRERLECILVLAAITASMVKTEAGHRRPVALGAGVGFLA